MVLSDMEANTIYAALQNGLGLVNPCRALHKDIIELSNYIHQTPSFEAECQKRITAGYQLLLSVLNDTAQKRNMNKWHAQRNTMDNFIIHINTWECICTSAEFSFDKFTMAIRRCKNIPETAVAMGLQETEIWNHIYNEPGLAQWMIQNNYQI